MLQGVGTLAATDSTTFSLAVPSERASVRDLAEVVFGFGIIMVVLWLPEREQIILGPVALLATLLLTLLRRPDFNSLGLGWRGLLRSLWVLPAAIGLTVASVLVARSVGTFHPLHNPDLGHVGGYVLWTLYQQFLLQDYFTPRLTRLLSSDGALAVVAAMFAVAHLPNLWLALATLVWGIVSCLLFRRYRSLYVLGLAQGLLGLCFAVCVPDAIHHHLRVGLGYVRYHG
jgi:membrane protease YdiL (CAAX protease family)